MAPIISGSTGQTSQTGSALLGIWIYFNLIFSSILLPLLVCTFIFSKKAKRHPTLVNLCMTWIFSGEFSLLLFYNNTHVGPEPSQGICIAQTSLLYGITPMWSVSVFMLFWYMAISICGDRAKSIISTKKLVFMLASPYVVQISFSVAALIISVNHPDKVSRDLRQLYCALSFHPLFRAMTAFTFIVCMGIIILEIHLAIIAYKNWCCLRDAGQHNGVDYKFIIRVLTFGIFVALGIIANIISMFSRNSRAPDIYAAIAGSAVFLIFGTQNDVIRTWCFWLKEPPAEPVILDPVQELRRNSFWRRSEPNFKESDLFADLPPPPLPPAKDWPPSSCKREGSKSAGCPTIKTHVLI